MKPLVFHPEARAELREAALYYEGQRAGLGGELRVEIEAALARILRNPKAFTQVDDLQRRKCLVGRFPYSIIFEELEEVIHVMAVAHQRRRPGYWSSRTAED